MSVLDMFRLDGKVALVTGAGQGFGRRFALALAEAGADVTVTDINEKTGQNVVKEIEALGRKSIFVKADVGKEDDIKAMVADTVEKLGGLDIAVNNAFAEVKSVLLCSTTEAQVMMKKAKGKIINIASISGTIVNVGGYSYCTTKAGIIMLTKCLAVEWARYNINVNSISPTISLTYPHRRQTKEWRAKTRALHPMGWIGRPEDLQGTLIYLASDASNYVTGRDIIVDGGHTLNTWLLNCPSRVASPMVSPEEEVQSLKHDLDMLGIKYDEHGIALE